MVKMRHQLSKIKLLFFLLLIVLILNPNFTFSKPIKFKIAVLDVKNNSTCPSENLKNYLSSALYLTLSKIDAFDAIQFEQIEKLIPTPLKNSNPTEKIQLLNKLISTDGYIVAYIDFYSYNEDTKEIILSGEFQILNSEGEIISKAKASGTSGLKLGYKGRYTPLLVESINDLAQNATEKLQQNISRNGKVVSVDKDIVKFTMINTIGLNIGAEIVILKENKVIARGLITEISHLLTAKISTLKDKKITEYDQVLVVTNPTKAEKTILTKEKQLKKEKKKINKWVSGLLGAGLLVALTKGQKDKPAQ